MTIVEFIRARLDEDEAVAEATLNANIRANMKLGRRPVPRWVPDGSAIRDESDGELGVLRVRHTWRHEADHIARHDPARVLAQVAAMRAIVDLHESWPVLVDQPPVVEFTKHTENLAAHMSQRMAWLTTQEYRKRFGTEPPTAPMLRHLATIWSDHPDYDPAWLPEGE